MQISIVAALYTTSDYVVHAGTTPIPDDLHWAAKNIDHLLIQARLPYRCRRPRAEASAICGTRAVVNQHGRLLREADERFCGGLPAWQARAASRT